MATWDCRELGQYDQAAAPHAAQVGLELGVGLAQPVGFVTRRGELRLERLNRVRRLDCTVSACEGTLGPTAL